MKELNNMWEWLLDQGIATEDDIDIIASNYSMAIGESYDWFDLMNIFCYMEEKQIRAFIKEYSNK